MRVWKFLLPAVVALSAAPAFAQENVPQQVRGFADATAGQSAPGDKVLIFSTQGAELTVSGMMLAPPDGWPQVPAGATAIMRTRATPGANRNAPPVADFDFVRRTNARLFVVGEWGTPPVMWEIVPHSDYGVRYRAIDADGAPGTWLTQANAPTPD